MTEAGHVHHTLTAQHPTQKPLCLLVSCKQLCVSLYAGRTYTLQITARDVYGNLVDATYDYLHLAVGKTTSHRYCFFRG